MILFELIPIAFECICYDVLTTVAIMLILYFSLRCLSEDIVKGIPFFAVGIALFILLCIQLSLMYGAIEVYNMASAIKIEMDQALEGMTGAVGIADSQQIMDYATQQYPLLGVYLNTWNLSCDDISCFSENMKETIEDAMTSYCWRRVFWSIGFIVTGSIIAMTLEKKSGKKSRTHEYSSSSYSHADDF